MDRSKLTAANSPVILPAKPEPRERKRAGKKDAHAATKMLGTSSRAHIRRRIRVRSARSILNPSTARDDAPNADK